MSTYARPFSASFFILFFVASLPALADGPGATDDVPGAYICSHSRIEALRNHPRVSLTDPPGGIILEAPEQTDVLHYDLDLEVRPRDRWIGGSNTITVTSLSDGLSTFTLRLRDNFKIPALRVDGVDATWTRLDYATIEIDLGRSIPAGENFTVYIEYNGKPASDGFGSVDFSGDRMWTLSETWYAYTWVPLKDINADKATADLRFTVPSALTAASNGRLVSVDDLGDGRRTFHWKTEYQTAPYLFSCTVADFVQYDRKWTYGDIEMPTQFFIWPEDDYPDYRNVWFESENALTVFSDWYGLYPFVNEKYGIAEFGWGGGMEHQTCTSQGSFGRSVTVHELAHQWWGDNVTCETWHDIWLNEGFATYSEAIYYEKISDDPAAALLSAMQNRKPGSNSDSVYVYDDTDLGRIFQYSTTYLKGGWVLHMLRHIVGDDHFFEILAKFRAKYEGSVAITADFQEIAEEVYGGDLSWFFGPWVYERGSPSYRWTMQNVKANGQWFLELTIEQLQSNDYPAFKMPIDIVATIDGVKQTYIAWNAVREKQYYLFPTPNSATIVAFDPNEWILRSSTKGSYVSGPPRLISASPTLGSANSRDNLKTISVGFHRDVVTTAADYTVTDATGAFIPFTFGYDVTKFVSTLTLTATPAFGPLTVTVADTIKDKSRKIPLDGEIADPEKPGSLPSGDGFTGGSATLRYRVIPVPGDLDCDGDVNFNDIDPFVIALIDNGDYERDYPNCWRAAADLDGNGAVNFNDIDPFVELLSR